MVSGTSNFLLTSKDYPTKSVWELVIWNTNVITCTISCNMNKAFISLQSVIMGFDVYLDKQIISINSINWLISVVDTYCVLWDCFQLPQVAIACFSSSPHDLNLSKLNPSTVRVNKFYQYIINFINNSEEKIPRPLLLTILTSSRS